MSRTTINLAPADVKKEGPSFDLPIAIGMLAASEQIETDQLDNFAMVGELALTGAVAPCERQCGCPDNNARQWWPTSREQSTPLVARREKRSSSVQSSPMPRINSDVHSVSQ
jgi:hypothetical protein